MSHAALSDLHEAPQTLKLIKESWRKGVHELQDEQGHAFARLDFSSWSGKAKADVTETTYAFSRVKGLFKRTITIEQDGEHVATMNLNTWGGGGRVTLDCKEYVLSSKGVITTTWTWYQDNDELITLRHRGSLAKGKGDVTITPKGHDDAHLELLTLLALHAVLTRQSDSSSAGGAAAAG